MSASEDKKCRTRAAFGIFLTKVEAGKDLSKDYLMNRNFDFSDIKYSFIVKLLTFLLYNYFCY